MRFIDKSGPPPTAISAFLAAQLEMEVPANLDYERGFIRKKQLCDELTAQQFGLCAYTGTPIDRRLGGFAAPSPSVGLRPHNEHLKPQSQCRQELIDAGKRPGFDLGEDMDHRNIVAALEVKGTDGERFGAAWRGAAPLPILPTAQGCETHFRFDRDGSINGTDESGRKTVCVLRLNHKTLQDWRKAAIDAFLHEDVIRTRADVQQLIDALDSPRDGELQEFAFCIRSAAEQLIG